MTRGEVLFFELLDRRDSGPEEMVYAQSLMTMFLSVGKQLYPLLERAEAENKKLVIEVPKKMENILWDDVPIEWIKIK